MAVAALVIVVEPAEHLVDVRHCGDLRPVMCCGIAAKEASESRLLDEQRVTLDMTLGAHDEERLHCGQIRINPIKAVPYVLFDAEPLTRDLFP